MDCGPVCIRMIAKYYGLESRTSYNIYVSIVFWLARVSRCWALAMRRSASGWKPSAQKSRLNSCQRPRFHTSCIGTETILWCATASAERERNDYHDKITENRLPGFIVAGAKYIFWFVGFRNFVTICVSMASKFVFLKRNKPAPKLC